MRRLNEDERSEFPLQKLLTKLQQSLLRPTVPCTIFCLSGFAYTMLVFEDVTMRYRCIPDNMNVVGTEDGTLRGS